MQSVGMKPTLFAAIAGTILALGSPLLAGPYSPTGDEPGSVAIPKESPLFTGWATNVVDLTRGPVDITVPGGAQASHGSSSGALGIADADEDTFNTVSLGDGGWITLSFANPITNGAGFDFAVFENSFQQEAGDDGFFLELAFVEVSSNGTDFFRFDSVSLTSAATQVASFGTMDPTDIHNLAGRDIAGYGTGFDLAELAGVSPLLNISSIQYVRIRDVVGSINPSYRTFDSLGNVINDPWKTNFSTGGFDLDAIGVIHSIPEPAAAALFLIGLASLQARRPKRRELR